MNEGPKRTIFSKIWHVDAAGMGVCLVMIFGAYWVGVAPVLDQAEAVTSQKLQLTEDIQQASRLTASRGLLTQQLADAQKAVESGAFQLRSVKRLNQYLARLTKLATLSKLTLQEIQPGKAVRDEHYWSVPVLMSGTGNYRTCALFLHSLHHALPDTRLNSFQLKAWSGKDRSPLAKFRFGLVWHAAPDQDGQ